MSQVVIYDTNDLNVTDFIKFANTPDYEGRPDVLINPDLSALQGIPLKYWKVEGGLVVEMSQSEKDAVDAENLSERIASIRSTAKSRYDGQSVDGQTFRALVKVLLEEINILRNAASLPDRTLSQAKTAIQNAIYNGTVDE